MDDLTLPHDAVLLHIGPVKTGTSAIQQALSVARPVLAEHGVLYPGRARRQLRPSLAVLRRQYYGGRQVPPIELWENLVRKTRAAEGRVCISTEDMGSANAREAARIVEGLGAERVHVVLTARRLDKLLPSSWQERVKNGEQTPYPDWLRIVLGTDTAHPVYRRFWRHHDLEATYRTWTQSVPADRFIVIMSDDSDRRLLHHTFESMLDLPSGILESTSENTSLSAGAVELVRRVNVAAAEQTWAPRDYRLLIHRGMVERLQGMRTEGDVRIPPIPAWAVERANELTAQFLEFLSTHAVRVVGDPEILRVPADEAPESIDAGPDVVSTDLAAAAVEGVREGMILRLAEEQDQHAAEIDALQQRIRELERRPGARARAALGRGRGTLPS